MPLQLILEKLGIPGAKYVQQSGGDINSCWQIQTSEKNYFLKVNDSARFPGMFELEANGLNQLREKSSFIIPAVLNKGSVSKDQFLLLEWLETKSTSNEDQYKAGKKLAMMHRNQLNKFGLEEDNYIGSLNQVNTWHPDWTGFYSNCRIMPLVRKLYDGKSFPRSVVENAEKFCQRLPGLFPAEPASFLHGDLWSGNFMTTTRGPALIDPAVYYGHREMDIGMTKLFGGFAENFYAGYNEIFPLEKHWEKRLMYSQLYPLLVHANLFGGSYVEKCVRILEG